MNSTTGCKSIKKSLEGVMATVIDAQSPDIVKINNEKLVTKTLHPTCLNIPHEAIIVIYRERNEFIVPYYFRKHSIS